MLMATQTHGLRRCPWLPADGTSYPGSNPLVLNRDAASGPVRNFMSVLAASGDLLGASIPAVKTVVLASSPGSGPTSCAPATGTISEAWQCGGSPRRDRPSRRDR